MNIEISRKVWILAGVTLALLALTLLVSTALAQEPGDGLPLAPAGGSAANGFSYQGRLLDNGQPVNGLYDFQVTIWDSDIPTANLVTTCLTPSLQSVLVEDGIFTLYLFPDLPMNQVFTGQERWIEIAVSPAGMNTYTILDRQPIAPAPYAWGLRAQAVISGDTDTLTGFGNAILNVDNTRPLWGGGHSAALYVRASTGSAVHSESGGVGVYGYSTWTHAIMGEAITGTAGYFTTEEGYGIRAITNGGDHWDHGGYFSANWGYGIYATSIHNMGIRGEGGDVSGLWQPAGPVGVAGIGQDYGVYGSGGWAGVYGTANSGGWYGGWFDNSDGGTALYAWGNGGVRWNATVRADNVQEDGGMAAYMTNRSNFHNAHFYNSGTGGVLYLQNGGTDEEGTDGGDFITAVNNPENDAQFRVLTTGEVRSDVGFNTPAADFAEMLPAVDGLEPGDVLVIGPDGKLDRSTQPNQASVVGVYSTQPGFVGGQPVEEDLEGHVPLAVMGVVPVKASAENGPIVPGDLLVASSTPGHAMKAGSDPSVGTIIGKALEPLDEGTGVIKMLVMLQ